MPDIADALFEDRTGTIISLEVTPGAKKESFPSGYNTWRNTIGCSVTAHAIGGKANRAVITLISKRLGIPATRVTIRSGSTNSQKHVHIREIDKGDLLIRLQALTG
jgi:uncharacterized protein (TIGR00251 family)